jgi:hypothetical protein
MFGTMVVPDTTINRDGTPGNFESFQKKNGRAYQIKNILDVGDVAFVTMPNTYGY